MEYVNTKRQPLECYNTPMKNARVRKITESVNASYSQFAEQFDQTRKQPWPEFHHFLAYTKKRAKVLDLGCGSGRLYEFLRPKQVSYLGVDHNAHLLGLARKKFPEARFQPGDLTALALEEEAFDNIFCIAAFHHVPSKKMRRKVLKDMHRALKPGGLLILTTWNLFQWKYAVEILKATLRSLVTLGRKGAWNDLWIGWGNHPLKRYYHSFLPGELKALWQQSAWTIEEYYFTRKGKRVRWFRSYNFVLILRKK